MANEAFDVVKLQSFNKLLKKASSFLLSQLLRDFKAVLTLPQHHYPNDRTDDKKSEHKNL